MTNGCVVCRRTSYATLIDALRDAAHWHRVARISFAVGCWLSPVRCAESTGGWHLDAGDRADAALRPVGVSRHREDD